MTILTPRRLAASLPFLALGTPVTALAVEYTELATLPVHAETDDFVARRDAPTTRLVYGREELDRMNELTVGDYLRKLPGVTFTGPPGTPKDVRLRGGDKGLTQILIDGEPVFGGGKERQIQVDRIPLDLVERVEVIRAPSADLPNEGLLGTINIVLRNAPPRRTAGVRAVGGRIFGEATDLDSWNLSGYYGNATKRAPGSPDSASSPNYGLDSYLENITNEDCINSAHGSNDHLLLPPSAPREIQLSLTYKY